MRDGVDFIFRIVWCMYIVRPTIGTVPEIYKQDRHQVEATTSAGALPLSPTHSHLTSPWAISLMSARYRERERERRREGEEERKSTSKLGQGQWSQPLPSKAHW